MEAARDLFDTLRWAEGVVGAQLVLLPYVASELIDQDLRAFTAPQQPLENITGGECDREKLGPGLADRIFRAASGRFVDVNLVH